jgi:hypothetical protein
MTTESIDPWAAAEDATASDEVTEAALKDERETRDAELSDAAKLSKAVNRPIADDEATP